MTKRYIFSREDLENLIHENCTFLSQKAQQCMEKGKVIMFSDRKRWIDEFLDSCLREIPMDTLLDKVDESLTSFWGRSLDDIKNDLRKIEPEYLDRMKNVEDYIKEVLEPNNC